MFTWSDSALIQNNFIKQLYLPGHWSATKLTGVINLLEFNDVETRGVTQYGLINLNFDIWTVQWALIW